MSEDIRKYLHELVHHIPTDINGRVIGVWADINSSDQVMIEYVDLVGRVATHWFAIKEIEIINDVEIDEVEA